MPTYLFVLCPPYCGSTLLWKLLATSPNASALPAEGQFLPEVESIMRDRPWHRDRDMPWEEIRAAWETHWDMDKPVLLEKSPPNLIRAQAIARHFDPCRFIIMVRNPYAHAEGLMRRNDWSVTRAGNFALMCLRSQLENTLVLDRPLVMTYESLVEDPRASCARLQAFLPELEALDHSADFEVHSVEGTAQRPITDFNAQKIAALSDEDFEALNNLFLPQRELLRDWGYAFMPARAGAAA